MSVCFVRVNPTGNSPPRFFLSLLNVSSPLYIMTSSNGKKIRVTGPLCVWTNCWVNNRDAGDSRHHRAHYDVTVFFSSCSSSLVCKPHCTRFEMHDLRLSSSRVYRVVCKKKSVIGSKILVQWVQCLTFYREEVKLEKIRRLNQLVADELAPSGIREVKATPTMPLAKCSCAIVSSFIPIWIFNPAKWSWETAPGIHRRYSMNIIRNQTKE